MSPAIGPFFLLKPSHSDRRALERRIPSYVTRINVPMITVSSPKLPNFQNIINSPPRRLFICSLPFNFPHVGITTKAQELTSEDLQDLKGWSIDRTRAQVGSGRDDYNTAVSALLNWRHFNFDWAFTNAPAIKNNAAVVVIAQSLLLWSMNPLRITAVTKNKNRKINEQSSGKQKKQTCCHTSFAHTTVAGHQISGEERFTVEWNKNTNSVWYEVYTISKPATCIATLAQPLLRFYQRQFVAQSILAMKKEVASSWSSTSN